jgi:dolichyl-phosphate-mannose-protein mannosyltransferase
VSPVVAPPPQARRLRVERPPAPVEPRVHAWREPLAVFLIAFAAYAALGLYTTLHLGIVLGDAESRLAHAYYVWWNEPSKLTAIGFFWPPLRTLALLPGAAIKPLATSLAALPLTSALFGGVLVAFVDRALALAPLQRRLRWAIVAAFALNPMIAYYATNGMAESLSLACLAAALFFFVRWMLEQRWQDLPLIGFAIALGALTRYEIAFWAPLVVAGIIVVQLRQRSAPGTIEGAVLAVLAPIAYAGLLWVFMNWAITGDPLGFLSFADQTASSVDLSPLELIGAAFLIHLALFPPALLLGVALVFGGVARRSVAALVLGGSLLMNVAETIGFVLYTQEDVPLLLRYNMRGIPIAVIATAWVLTLLPARRRTLLAVAAIGVLCLSNVASAATMLVAPFQLGEHSFLVGLATGENQEGKPGPNGPDQFVSDQHDMAGYITRSIGGRNAVFTDDSETYGVILRDGHPERYLDRIDISDRRWRLVLERPVARVRYMLVNSRATSGKDIFFYDRIVERYPSLAAGEPPPFLRLVYKNPTFALYRVTGGLQ